jgi:hypothetical protein
MNDKKKKSTYLIIDFLRDRKNRDVALNTDGLNQSIINLLIQANKIGKVSGFPYTTKPIKLDMSIIIPEVELLLENLSDFIIQAEYLANNE